MDKLLKLEKYQLLHNSIYWCGMIGIFILGFFTADTYVTEVMGPTEEIASSLTDIFNGMVYDSTFLLIIMSAILALILGQEFSKRTINLEVSAGHSRFRVHKGIWTLWCCRRGNVFLQYYKSNHLFLSA